MTTHSAERVRADVPGLTGIVFFNAAGMGSPPRPALAALAGKLALLERGTAGRTWAAFVEEFEDGVLAAKREGARMLGAEPDEIALTSDTTGGLQHAMQAIPFRPGDNLVLSDLEYPSVALAAAAADAAREDGALVSLRRALRRAGRRRRLPCGGRRADARDRGQFGRLGDGRAARPGRALGDRQGALGVPRRDSYCVTGGGRA